MELKAMVSLEEGLSALKNQGARAVTTFLRFIESRVGGTFIFSADLFPFGKPELYKPFRIAEDLKKSGVLSHFYYYPTIPDEPKLIRYVTRTTDELIAGGTSLSSHLEATYPAIAEGLERFLWNSSTSYFKNPKVATQKDQAHALPLEKLAGYPQERMSALSETPLLWIDGYSHTQRRKVRVPASLVSAAHGRKVHKDKREPVLRLPITTGLATAESKKEALLKGALEVIERDAFMIAWLNSLTLPRLPLKTYAKTNPQLHALLTSFKRYNLIPHAVHLLTDAPVSVVCGVLADETGIGPAFTVGARAHEDIKEAIYDSLEEALAVRLSARKKMGERLPEVKEYMRDERIIHWAKQEHKADMRFFISGKETYIEEKTKRARKLVWEDILSWCKEKKYECLSVPMTSAKENASPWHVEYVLIPELQPLYLVESLPALSGNRLSEIPKKFGYPAKQTITNLPPHPFP